MEVYDLGDYWPGKLVWNDVGERLINDTWCLGWELMKQSHLKDMPDQPHPEILTTHPFGYEGPYFRMGEIQAHLLLLRRWCLSQGAREPAPETAAAVATDVTVSGVRGLEYDDATGTFRWQGCEVSIPGGQQHKLLRRLVGSGLRTWVADQPVMSRGKDTSSRLTRTLRGLQIPYRCSYSAQHGFRLLPEPDEPNGDAAPHASDAPQ